MHNQQNQQMKNCIHECWECRDICQDTLYNHCLQMGGRHVEAGHVKLMADCIDACQAAADFMRRCSQMHSSMCMACADICEACAESCGQIGGEEMQRCAEACRTCADSCRKMGEMKQAA
jgi:hypothetical protein